LSEKVTQIITIVSSIVAVCKDNFPAASAMRGAEILRELTEHANRLSETQAGGRELSKDDRQAMAKSSYSVANNMKELIKL
jgi:protein SPA2